MRNITSPLAGFSLLGRLRSSVSIYAVLGFEPPLVFDFTSEYYRTGGNATTFDNAITPVASTNATMVDSDGKLKWRPHNLLTYSEQFDNAAWTKNSLTISANSSVAPDGTTTADTLTGTGSGVTFLRSGHIYPTGSAVNLSIYVKAGTATTVTLGDVNLGSLGAFNLTTGTVISGTTAQISGVGADWYLCSVSFTPINPASFFLNPGSNISPVTTESIIIWGAHLYRSDLGGMVNNPDRGDSYVPTTSAARYLPRRGHHVYNGSAWVNKGLLVESEARTNLVTYSDAFNNAAWAKGGVTVSANVAVSPDGTSNADKMIPSTVNTDHYAYQSVSPATGTNTVSIYAKAAGYSWIALFCNSSPNAVAWFNLSNGTVGVVSGTAATKVANIKDIGSGWFRVSLTATAGTNLASGYAVTNTDGSVTFAGDGTSGIYIYGAQLEAGSTPSSYIPTAGATATRAAETFTVPADNLPWPTPKYVTGTELVTNGTFDIDTSGWTAIGDETLSSVSGRLRVTYGADGFGGGSSGTYQAISGLTIGQTYNLVCGNRYVGTNGAVGVRVTTAAAGGTALAQFYGFSDASNEMASFVAPSTTLYVQVYGGYGTAGTYVEADSISVKEINPLAVSIQMKGEMTYADGGVSVTVGGQTGEVVHYSWRLDGNNYIAEAMQTLSGDTGRPIFLQAASGIYDSVAAAGSSYTPGINVPFNIASRHGSTFINGAVDGVALTADLTPVALPDLHATNLNFGYTFMGTISEFRMWADDLGNTGIAEASL